VNEETLFGLTKSGHPVAPHTYVVDNALTVRPTAFTETAVDPPAVIGLVATTIGTIWLVDGFTVMIAVFEVTDSKPSFAVNANTQFAAGAFGVYSKALELVGATNPGHVAPAATIHE
jgi:hypothetical protein